MAHVVTYPPFQVKLRKCDVNCLSARLFVKYMNVANCSSVYIAQSVMKWTKGKRVPIVHDGNRQMRFNLNDTEQGFNKRL